MSEAKVRVAVAGAGMFGRNHLRVIRESGRTLLLDREEMLELAQQHKIAIVGYPPEEV